MSTTDALGRELTGPTIDSPSLLALRSQSGWRSRPRIGTVLADTAYLVLSGDADRLASWLADLAPDVDGYALRDRDEAVDLEHVLAGRLLELDAFHRPAPEPDTSVGGVNLGSVPDGRPARLRCCGPTAGRAGADFAPAVALWQLLCSPLLVTRFTDELGADVEPQVSFRTFAQHGTIEVELVVDGALVADAECLVRETLAALGRPESVASYRARYPVPTLADVDQELARSFAELDEQLFPVGTQSGWTVLLSGPDAVPSERVAEAARRILATYTAHAGADD